MSKTLFKENNPVIARHLKRTGGFRDVAPTLLASGEIGIYYCNTEKLVEDAGEFNNYGDDSQAMIRHAVGMMAKNPNFMEVISILAANSAQLLDGKTNAVISGGQRRDWLFSGPVAHVLGVPHVSLYKQNSGQADRVEVLGPDGKIMHDYSIAGTDALHIVDLITEGSSCLSEDVPPQGWIPMLRARGAKVSDLYAVVSRLQGGEERLGGVGVQVHSEVAIDSAYLREHSQNPEAAEYFANPENWSREFLARDGAVPFVKFFDPSGGKTDRARKFMERYGRHLSQIGKFDELASLVQKNYRRTVTQVVKGESKYEVSFAEKWRSVVSEKNSILCAGLDPAEFWSRPDNTLPADADKLNWCLTFIDKIAPYCAGVKINGNFVEDLSGSDKTKLVQKIHEQGMVAIWDRKLPDIGATNDAGLYHSEKFGFDAVTYSPFPGNFEEVAVQSHNRGLGVIGMGIMSNPQYRTEKNKLVDVTDNSEGYALEDIVEMTHPKLGARKFVPQFVQLAHDAGEYKWDGVVIGAPSPGNHVTLDEVARIKHYVGDKTIALIPGVGAQGGDAAPVIKMFGDNSIVNVGTAVLYANDPAKEAEKYQKMLNELRKAA